MAKTKLHVEDNFHLDDNVSESYKKFFNRFNEIETLDLVNWKTLHILAYICKKYEDYYGMKYSFKFNNPSPSKSFEIYQVKKLANMLSADPEILKNYLDWVFEKKIVERNKRITSLGYFTHTDIVNEFKFKFLFNKKNILIERTDNLPANIIEICIRYGFNISTYAELAFIKKMPHQDKLFEELIQINFQVDILDKIA